MFDEATRSRLFGAGQAFSHPVTVAILVVILAGMVVSGAAIVVASRTGRIAPETARELRLRWTSWCWLTAAMVLPILLGAAWTILAVCVLSLLCYREFARATGVFRQRTISIVVVLGILAITFANLDHYERLFLACGPLGTALIVVGTIQADEPKGFIQRVALGVLGFLLFGFSLGYLGLMAGDADYRPLLLLVLLSVELNDVFAWCCGKLIGGPKLLPSTSPNKTVAGAMGALVLTTLLVCILGGALFRGTAAGGLPQLVALGVLISGLAQLGDLTLSSIKRDIGVKDLSHTIPGHGGLLDRFDSLVLVPPAVYHYLSLYLGPLGADQPARIFTSG